MNVELLCSNRPRPSVQKGAKGNQHWMRDVFHAAGENNKTLCGVATDGWLRIETRPAPVALADQHFCRRCAAKLPH